MCVVKLPPPTSRPPCNEQVHCAATSLNADRSTLGVFLKALCISGKASSPLQPFLHDGWKRLMLQLVRAARKLGLLACLIFLSVQVFALQPGEFDYRNWGLVSPVSRAEVDGAIEVWPGTGVNIEDLAHLYVSFFESERNSTIHTVSHEAILEMIVELNTRIDDSGIQLEGDVPVVVAYLPVYMALPELIDDSSSIDQPKSFVNKIGSGFGSLLGGQFSGAVALGETEQSSSTVFLAALAADISQNTTYAMYADATYSHALGPSEERYRYEADLDSRRRFICLDLDIILSEECVGDACLASDVREEIAALLDDDQSVVAYPLYDSDTFLNATAEEAEAQQAWCNAGIPGLSNPRIFLDPCPPERTDDLACARKPILLRYRDGDPASSARIVLLLFESTDNTFLDAITLNLDIEANAKGEVVSINLPESGYEKIQKIAFPADVDNRHTIVSIDNGDSFRFAQMSKLESGELNLSSWVSGKENFEETKGFNTTKHFETASSLRSYGDLILTAIFDPSRVEDYEARRDAFLSDGADCETPNRVELVYPNKPRHQIEPITIEYAAIEGPAGSEPFLGDCYLVTHRNQIPRTVNDTISSIQLYQGAPEYDFTIQEVNSLLDKRFSEKSMRFLPKPCSNFFGRDCQNNGQQLFVDGRPVNVFLHRELPTKQASHHRSLVIITAHQDGGSIRFGDRNEIAITDHANNIWSNDFLLNMCGNPQVATISKVVGALDYDNLVFANKKIAPLEAAVVAGCTIEEFTEINEQCISMTEWVGRIRQCVREEPDLEDYNGLAYHYMGSLGKKVCGT